MKIKKSEQCEDCHDQLCRVRHGKRFSKCEDCRRTSVVLQIRVRKVKRILKNYVGGLVSYNYGEGWRTGYLVEMNTRNAQVQPIGARGKVPDIVVVSLGDIKAELLQSPSCPTVADYYAKNGVKPKPAVVACSPRELRQEVREKSEGATVQPPLVFA